MTCQATLTQAGPATDTDTVAESSAEDGRAALPVRGAVRRAARVRPYAITGGRTRSGYVLQVETIVAAVDGPADQGQGQESGNQDRQARRARQADPVDECAVPEAGAIVSLCRSMRSVAEISALLGMPLGVVRVLLSDLADQGKIRVYGTGHGPGAPDHALLERVLSGLRRL